MRDIGKNIKDLRIAKKLTQDQLAEKLFVTRQTVSNYENGKSRPDIDMIIKLGEVLDCDVNDIIYGKEKYKKNCIPFAVSFSLFLLLAAVSLWGVPYTLKLKGQTYLGGPYYLFVVFIVPFTISLAVWSAFELLSLTAGLKPIKHKHIKYFKIVFLAFALYFVLSNIAYWTPIILYDFFTITSAASPISYDCINNYVTNSFIIKLATPIIYFVYRYGNLLMYSFFAVSGALLWLFDIPRIDRNHTEN